MKTLTIFLLALGFAAPTLASNAVCKEMAAIKLDQIQTQPKQQFQQDRQLVLFKLYRLALLFRRVNLVAN